MAYIRYAWPYWAPDTHTDTLALLPINTNKSTTRWSNVTGNLWVDLITIDYHLHEGFPSNKYPRCLVQNTSVHVHTYSCTFTYSNINAWILKFRTFRNTSVAKKLRHRHGELYDTNQLKCKELKANNSLIHVASARMHAYTHKIRYWRVPHQCSVGYVIKQAPTLKLYVLWTVTLYHWAWNSRRFESSQCLHLQNQTGREELELNSLFLRNIAPHDWAIAARCFGTAWRFQFKRRMSTTHYRNVGHQPPSDTAPYPRKM